jgi:hypothetical protein
VSTISQRSFAGGEFSPALQYRVDVQKYYAGAKKLRNVTIMKGGGAINRSGTKYIGEVSDSTKNVRLIPFVFNESESHVLELNNDLMRIINQGGHVLESAKNITGITQANPAVVTSNAHGFQNGQEVFIEGIVGMNELNNKRLRIKNRTTNTFELEDKWGVAVNSTGFTAYSSGGTAKRIYQISIVGSQSINTNANLPVVKFAQLNNTIVIGNIGFYRWSLANWTSYLNLLGSSFSIATPGFEQIDYDQQFPSISVSGSTHGFGGVYQSVYCVYAVTFGGAATFAATTTCETTPTSSATRTLTITKIGSSVTPIKEYWIFRSDVGGGAGKHATTGVFGRIAVLQEVADTNQVLDNGITPNYTFFDPGTDLRGGTIGLPPGYGTNGLAGHIIENFPHKIFGTAVNQAICFFQQRQIRAFGTDVIASKIGIPMYSHTWLQQNNASAGFHLRLADLSGVTIKHLLPYERLLVFTDGAEYVVEGSATGAISSTNFGLKKQSSFGCSDVRPLVIENDVVFVQADGRTVRSFQYEQQTDGFRGTDLTVFAGHLFKNKKVKDWSYQRGANVLWVIFDDGSVASCTYLREQEMLAWSRHDFSGGHVEQVAVIPEGGKDTPYFVVRRIINGRQVKYIERLTDRSPEDFDDLVLMDCSLSYDGRNKNLSRTMTIQGSNDYDENTTLTLVCSQSFFSAADVGKEVHIKGADGTLIRFSIDAYTDATTVTGKPSQEVPLAMRWTAINSWGLAVNKVSGLEHLEGQNVAVTGDQYVEANPLNDDYPVLTVTGGEVSLSTHYVVIHAGLPYVSDVETLNIDTVNSETMINKAKNVQSVTIAVEETRGLWVGPEEPKGDDPLENLNEVKVTDAEGYEDVKSLQTGVIDVTLTAEWNSNGRVFIRQIDPLPMSVLAIVPSGYFPFRGGG